MNGLMAAVAGCLRPVTSEKTPKQIILTSGTLWTVPADWNSANNKIECIGAGWKGGGAYAAKNNIALTPGSSVSYQVGTASLTQSVANTWFGSTTTVEAVGSIGAIGGNAASCVGDVANSGGSLIGTSTLGGGGAGGPNGNGLDNSGSTGGAGDAGFGGLGGVSGSPGSDGTEWGTAGSGGGGGYQGKAGKYGGGSGNNQGVNGSPGVIVITYTPA